MLRGRAWTFEELAWARESANAGDSLEGIADALECTADTVKSRLGLRRAMTPREALVASLYVSGSTQREIDRQLGRNGYAHTVLRQARRAGFDVPRRLTALAVAKAALARRAWAAPDLAARAGCSLRQAQRARAASLRHHQESRGWSND